MRLLFIFAALLAITIAQTVEDKVPEEDLEAAASVELLKSEKETLETAASAYNYLQPSYAPKPWDTQSGVINKYGNNYYPQNNYVENSPPTNNWNPPQNNYVPPQNNYVPPQNNYVPPQNNYVPPQNNYVPPQNNYVPPQNDYVTQSTWAPQSSWTTPQPPQSAANYPPQPSWTPPATAGTYPPRPSWTTPKPSWTPAPPAGTYPPQPSWTSPQNTWSNPSTESVAVIKNEQTYGDDGSYKYEYQIADGTHVGEEGYLVNPNTDKESVVKKGWYSYPGADGKIYTVTYWADDTGFHAFGDHLPTPPPVPKEIQAALDQAAKDEANQAQADKNKPQQGYYPTTQKPPQQGYYPSNQQTYPQQQYPQQQQTYPQQQQTYPQQQQTYPQQQQTYPQQQQTYPQQQQSYYPPSYGK